MDASRLSLGEKIAGGSGLALFIFMFFPWYGIDIGIGSDDFSAWTAFDFIDLLLFLIAAVAIGFAAGRAAGAIPPTLPAPPGTIVAAAGALAALLILYRIVELPGPDVEGVEISRKLGVFLGLIASLGIVFGGATSTNERGYGRVPR